MAGVGTPSEILAFAGQSFNPPIPQQTLLNCLNSHPSATVFQAANGTTSGLEPHLSSTAKSHLILPFRSHNRPQCVIIASSSRPDYAFPPPDVSVIRSVGSVLRARTVQQTVMSADAAKTSFLSSISHELRTPMHGVKASLELIRMSADAKEWDEMEGPLCLAEASGRALLNILNDVLDFGKDGWDKTEETKIDLKESAREIATICLTDYADQMGNEAVVRLVHENRDWSVKMSEAKYHR